MSGYKLHDGRLQSLSHGTSQLAEKLQRALRQTDCRHAAADQVIAYIPVRSAVVLRKN